MSTAYRPIADIAFPKWLELTGVDPCLFQASAENAASLESVSMDHRQWTLTAASIVIFDCLSLNDHELTAQLMLARQLDVYTKDHRFALEQMLSNPEAVARQVTLIQQIRSVLDSADGLLRRAEFASRLEAAASHYGVSSRADIQEVIDDDNALAVLRRDALTALDAMRLSQFSRGAEGALSRPRYSTVVRRWWDVDHLLAAHAAIPEGVSLNLIRTPADHDVFFCFVIRRGANLYVMDDATEYEHPLQSGMSRSPGRKMSARVAKFWFPYDLTGVEITADGKRTCASSDADTSARGVAIAHPSNEFSQIIGSIAELPPSEFLWVVMVFDLIMDRFWSSTEDLPEPPLSYTAFQIQLDPPMLHQAAVESSQAVTSGPSGSAAVPSLTVSQVATLHQKPDAVDVLGDTGVYQSLHWMEERYAHRIPESALNLVAAGNDLPRLEHDGSLVVVEASAHKAMEDNRFWGRDTALLNLKAMDVTAFGTADRLRADRGFLARYNYAASIGAFAKQEYAARHKEVEQWLTKAYAQRVEFLLTLVPSAQDNRLEIIDWHPGEGPDEFEFKGGLSVRFGIEPHDSGCSHRLASIVSVEDRAHSFSRCLPATPATRNGKPLCHVTGQLASYYLVVRPTNAIELAWVLGCDTVDLPDVLRPHSALVPACGNPILNRIDPMLWALHNPWHAMDLRVRLPLSKRGLARLGKTPSEPIDVSCLHGVNLRMFQGQ